MATLRAMTSLLTFLGAVFYGGLAIILAVAIIEQRRAARRQAAEQAPEKPLQKAA
jgi:hypothetical protein